jgi:hypothetical protein
VPITLVATQQPDIAGSVITFAAPNASGSGGNYCLYSEHTSIRFIATGGAAATTTITIETPDTLDGNALADRTATLSQSSTLEIPLRPVYRQADGTVKFNASATITGITVAVVHTP